MGKEDLIYVLTQMLGALVFCSFVFYIILICFLFEFLTIKIYNFIF
jgi:hypothetical protein